MFLKFNLFISNFVNINALFLLEYIIKNINKKMENKKEEKKKIYIYIKNKDSIIISEKRDNLNIKKKDKIGEIFNDELNLLQNLWDKLEVNNEYRTYFINNIKTKNDSDKKEIFKNEKKNLEKLTDLLIKLKDEKISRDKNKKSLKECIINIEDYISQGNSINTSSDVFKEISKIIEQLRYNAINIVHLMSSINKIIFSNKEKWNINNLENKYSYNPNYLYKMKNDLQFLKNSILDKFIEMNKSRIDPFLTNFIPISGNFNTNKIKIPISEDLKKEINKSKYILTKETIYSNNNIIINNKKFRIKRNNINKIHINTISDFKNNKNINNNDKNDYTNNNYFITEKNKNKLKQLRKKNLSCNINYNVSGEIYNNKKDNEIFKINSPLYSSFSNTEKLMKMADISQSKYIETKNILLNEKEKNNNLNNEIIELKKENKELKKKLVDINNLYEISLNKNDEVENNIIKKDNDINILQNKLKEINIKNEELLDVNKVIAKNIKIINELNDKIKELETKINDTENENQKSKEECNKQLDIIAKKDEEILNLKNKIKSLKPKDD